MRILTYNVHRWLGTDRRSSPERVAEVIASCQPDVVALQEARIGRPRRGEVDALTGVARFLGMDVHFHPTIRVFGEQFGLALLTSRRSRLVKSDALPGLAGALPLERRGALWVAVEGAEGREVQVINTHLSLRPREREQQAGTLLGHDWLGHPACHGPAILLGDLNARPGSRAYERLAQRMKDVQLATLSPRPQSTFHTRLPFMRIDHVFVTEQISVSEVATVRTPLARVASDHVPLVADLRIPGEIAGNVDAARFPARAEAA